MPKRWSRRDAIRALGLSLGTTAIPFSSFATDENKHPILLPGKKLNLDKPVTAITCGAGARGNVYGNYAVKYPDQLDIVGVAEPIALRNERYTRKSKVRNRVKREANTSSIKNCREKLKYTPIPSPTSNELNP